MKTVRKNNRNLKRKFSKRKKTTKRRINKKTNNKKYQKRIKRKTRRQTKRKLKRSVKRYDIQKGGALQDYGEGHANTCLNGAIEIATKFTLGINAAIDEYHYLPEDGNRATVKVSFIRHSESTSNTQFGQDRGGKAMQLAMVAEIEETEATRLDWGGKRTLKNEMYWGYTHAFLTGYGRMQAYSTGYYKLWEMFCNGDYDMDLFCSVLPRACQSAKLATTGFIQRLMDAKDERDAGTLDSFMGDCPPECMALLQVVGNLESIIEYYEKKSIKIINGISEIPEWKAPDVSETQRCMREDLLPDMVKFLNEIESGCDLILDGLDVAFTGRVAPPGELDRPRNYDANDELFSSTRSKFRGLSGYMTTEDSIFSFLFRLSHWFQRTAGESSNLGTVNTSTWLPGGPSDIRNICFVHGIMMGEYMPWPLFTDSIKQILGVGSGVGPAVGPDVGPEMEPEPEPMGQDGGSGQAGGPMEGYVTGVDEAKKYFPDIDFATKGVSESWPYESEVATYRSVEKEIYGYMSNSYRSTVIKMDSNGKIELGEDVIRDNKVTPCSISFSKAERKGRPNFIVIKINERTEKINFIDSRAGSDYRRFLRDAMCVNCRVSLQLFSKIPTGLRTSPGDQTRSGNEQEMKDQIFRGLFAQLQTIPQDETPEIYESLLSQFLFYGKYSKRKLTAETVKNAIKAVGLSPDVMRESLETDEDGFNKFDRVLRGCYEECMKSLTLYEGGGEKTGWEGILRSINDFRDEQCFESSFMKQPPNATCVSFQLDNFPQGGLQDAYHVYKSATSKKPINFWSLFLHKNVSGVEFKSPPLRLKKPDDMGSTTQSAYNLLVEQIKQADVNNYYHTNPMIIMVFREVSRYDAHSGGKSPEMLNNLYQRCKNIINIAFSHVHQETSSYYFPLTGGRDAQLQEIFGGGWESGWGFDTFPVFATLLDALPEGDCLKEKPKMVPSSFERCYAKIKGNSLNIYNTKPLVEDVVGKAYSSPLASLKSSIFNLSGCKVTQVYDSGLSEEPFQIQISGVNSEKSKSPPSNGIFKINFNELELELANKFYIALRNISKGREYNALFEAEEEKAEKGVAGGVLGSTTEKLAAEAVARTSMTFAGNK